jgi:hypothetical protein
MWWALTRSHLACVQPREYKKSVAVRLADAAREVGPTDPELFGAQPALLLGGTSAGSSAPFAIPTSASNAALLSSILSPRRRALESATGKLPAIYYPFG